MRKLFEKDNLKLTILPIILLAISYIVISFGIFYGLLYLIGYLLHFHVTIQIALGIWLLLAFIKTFVFSGRS